jgi:hypothetical protein
MAMDVDDLDNQDVFNIFTVFEKERYHASIIFNPTSLDLGWQLSSNIFTTGIFLKSSRS